MSGIGHLGELEVINYLEKEEGFAVYLPIKEKGIDFVAVKKNHCYQIQVKCSTFQKTAIFGLTSRRTGCSMVRELSMCLSCTHCHAAHSWVGQRTFF